MKREIVLLGLFLTAVSLLAVPVKRNVKKEFRLADGSVLTAVHVGDEFGHWWQTEDGRKLVETDGSVRVLSEAEFMQMKNMADENRANRNAEREQRLMSRRRKAGSAGVFVGQKRGLVILVNYSDLSMRSLEAKKEFDEMFNLEGYSKYSHIGSVHDYFKDQSYGKFDLQFDVVGPVTVANGYKYYGQQAYDNQDSHPGELVAEACRLVDAQVDFADYDWDGDGEVDQVFVIYAGHGANIDGADSNLIWPHEFNLTNSKKRGDGTGPIYLDGRKINTYAVTCELKGISGTALAGMGTACHEFSHCLGYPDLYDPDYSGGWGMDSWDLLDSGSYNGPNQNGEIPCGYSAYERWVAGWLTPTELEVGMKVDGLKPVNDNAEAYIVYNDRNRNEYYLLENRKADRWFSYHGLYPYSKNGLLVMHVDYDADVWADNSPNDLPAHQRMTIIPANNKQSTNPTASEYNGHLYPYATNNALTNETTPAATLFNANTDGRRLMSKPIVNIAVNDDATIRFACGEVEEESQILFYESFDGNQAEGGNDGLWSQLQTTVNLSADNEGWTSPKAYGGCQCARTGTSKIQGTITSPKFRLEGKATLTFRAGNWDNDKDQGVLKVYINDEVVPVGSFEIARAGWTTVTQTIEGNGDICLRFEPQLRFFLDDVKVAVGGEESVTVLKGDANDDGSITMSDANLVVNAYTTGDNSKLNVVNADVTSDDEITMSDANAIVNIFVGE